MASATSDNARTATLYVCLSVAIFVFCLAVLCFSIYYLYWRSARDAAALCRAAQGQTSTAAEEGKQEGSVKKQVQLPVVVVQPDYNLEYGREESRFFRVLPRSSQSPNEISLPNMPPEGSYYVEGAPGFFEVELDSRTPRSSRTSFQMPIQSPRSPTKLGA